jgi:hypothetical protein
MGENTKGGPMDTPTRFPLLPDRHPIQDFFICDVADAIPKDDMGLMEHSILSLAIRAPWANLGCGV